ncbi:MAG TPA: hypothetical protein VHD90_24310, partial [Phototrophicaceae bacterium]|nr:hypothetical protein [Phototrophicaceae bacterium]
MTEYDDNSTSASGADQEPTRGNESGSTRPHQEFRTLGMRLLGSARQHIRRYSATANQPVPELPHSWNISEPLAWTPQTPPAEQISRAPVEPPSASQPETTAEEPAPEPEVRPANGFDPILTHLLKMHQERVAREEAEQASNPPQPAPEQASSAANPSAETETPAYNPPAIMRTTTRRRGAVIDVTPPLRQPVEHKEAEANSAAPNAADGFVEPSAPSVENQANAANAAPSVQRQIDETSRSSVSERETPPPMSAAPALAGEAPSVQREAALYSSSRAESAEPASNSAGSPLVSPQANIPSVPSPDNRQDQTIG